MHKNEIRPLSSHYKTNINSKWTTELNVRTNFVKHLAVNIRENLCGLGLGDDFLGMTSKPQATKNK